MFSHLLPTPRVRLFAPPAHSSTREFRRHHPFAPASLDPISRYGSIILLVFMRPSIVSKSNEIRRCGCTRLVFSNPSCSWPIKKYITLYRLPVILLRMEMLCSDGVLSVSKYYLRIPIPIQIPSYVRAPALFSHLESAISHIEPYRIYDKCTHIIICLCTYI